MTDFPADMDTFNRVAAERLPGHLGIRILSVGGGKVEAELDIRPHHLAPNGYLHAGSVVTLADTAAGFGCMEHLPPGANSFTTIELKSNFLGTARDGVIRCTATGTHLGRTTQVWDAVVTDRAGKTPALFRCTQMVLYPRSGGIG